MSASVRYSPMALRDMDEIWEGVLGASCDFDTADEYVSGIRNALSQKTGFPKSGKRLFFLDEFTGIYYVSYKAYHAFYRVCGKDLEVSRILPSKSDYCRILFGESPFQAEDLEDGSYTWTDDSEDYPFPLI